MTTLPEAGPLRAQLFGSVRIWCGGRELTTSAWARRAERSLCLVLLATPDHRLSREQIVQLLWPEMPAAAARNTLSKALHALRHVLEPGLAAGQASAYLASDKTEIWFQPDLPLDVDVDRFEALLTEAKHARDAERIPLLQRALTLATGDLLASEIYADWPVRRRETIAQARRHATIELAQLALAAGTPIEARDALEALTAAEPTNEEAQLLLMRIYAAIGHPERALDAFERCREALRDELDTEPGSEIAAFVASLRTPNAASPSAPAPPLVLPPVPAPPTPLVGRGRELDLLHDCLRQPDFRLVTITGPAGVGKTRLAQELAQATDDFPGGVVFVQLAALRDPVLVLPTIAHAVGATGTTPEQQRAAIQRLIGQRRVLLVLDNFEQLVPAASELATLLAACPGLKLLVTSRTRLHGPWEQAVHILPLAVPPAASTPTARTMQRYPAAELLLARLQEVQPNFVPSDDVAPIIGAICRRLDGLPLALELAAARGRHLSPAALLARLDHRLELLTGGPRDLPAHQQTLRATLAWSYDALSPLAQTLFRRLAVCAGGFTADAASWLMRGPGSDVAANDAPEVGAALARLVENSLIRQEMSEPEPRYLMLETMREFGQEQLRLTGELAAARAAHAAWVLAIAERLDMSGSAVTPPEALDRLELEHDNLRAALDWLRSSRDGDSILRLCLATRDFWWIRGYLSEGADWLERGLEQTAGQVTASRARAFSLASSNAEALGEFDRAETQLEASLAIWRQLGDQLGICHTLNLLGQVAMSRGNFHRARAYHTEAMEIARTIEAKHDLAVALAGLANVETSLHDYPASEAHYKEAIALFRELNAVSRIDTALTNLGVLVTWQGDLDRALAYLGESLALSRKLGHRRNIATTLANIATVQSLRGNRRDAVALVSDALQIYQEIGAQHNAAQARAMLADMVHQQGNDEAAVAHLRQAVSFLHQVNDQASLLECLELAARIKPLYPDPRQSARLLAAAAAQREALDAAREPPNQAAYDAWLADLRAVLGDASFAAAWEAGRALSLAEAVATLLPPTPPPNDLAGVIDLTTAPAIQTGTRSRAG